MKSFATIVFATLLAVVVNAMPAVDSMTKRGGSPTPANQCNVGEVQCCNSVTQADDKSTSHIIKSLNIKNVVGNTAVGLGCSPLNIIGIGGNSCNAQPVCCENNHFNGLVAIGCTPININL